MFATLLSCYYDIQQKLEAYIIAHYYFAVSRETFNSLTNWLVDARSLASPNIVIILVGNKKDLDAEREVTFLEASRFAQENGQFTMCLLCSMLEKLIYLAT